MAPAKSVKPITEIFITKNRTTRLATKPLSVVNAAQPRVKRKADASPVKDTNATKRSALGDVTNQKKTLVHNNKAKQSIANVPKKVTVKSTVLPSVKTVVKPKQNENAAPPNAPVVPKVQTRASLRNSDVNSTALKPKEISKDPKVKTRLSNEFEKSEVSLYSSALEDVNDSTRLSSGPPVTRSRTSQVCKSANVTLVALQLETKLNLGNHEVPEGVTDFDKDNWNDVFQASHYTMDIFNYLKSREPLYTIRDYMDSQSCLTRWMRSLLVDWMVEVQESFELNHETLYLGVKLVDSYLSRVIISKEILQLVGAASMLIASKYDERIPPLIDDFLYICDGAYTHKELVRMEINILKVSDINLGFPLSYRFLRRYARCLKISMPVLTLARFILEYSLMDYATIFTPDSKLASASLYLALKMKQLQPWNKALEFYSGYKLEQIMSTVHLLNTGLHRKPREQLMTIRNKYSHKIFFEVAKTPLIKNEDLF